MAVTRLIFSRLNVRKLIGKDVMWWEAISFRSHRKTYLLDKVVQFKHTTIQFAGILTKKQYSLHKYTLRAYIEEVKNRMNYYHSVKLSYYNVVTNQIERKSILVNSLAMDSSHFSLHFDSILIRT